MVELDRLRAIADDLSKSEWCMGLSAALHKTLEDIERETEDISGYESDVLAWVEKNGGLDAVRERLMPGGMEWLLEVWPKWSNGEYCKFGDWWKADKYGKPEPNQFLKLSIYTPEQLREWGQDDGDHFGYEWDFMRPSDTTYRPDKAEPPEPKVLDADGVEVREGDEVWSTTGGFDGKRTVKSVHVDEGEPPYAFFEEGREPWSFLCCCLTHRAPVLAADGKLLEVGQTVWRIDTGVEYWVKSGQTITADAVVIIRKTDCDCESEIVKASQLTHRAPVLAADGKPLREGETVWDVETGREYVVVEPSYGKTVVVRLAKYDDAEGEQYTPDQLTHERPDSWERIEREIERGKTYTDVYVLSIVRRCRALAERGE